jgi:hypothetical protein
VSIAAVANIAAGAIGVRLARRQPFDSWSDACLGGFAGAILLDCLLVFGLGGLGLFYQGMLAVALALLIGTGMLGRPIVRGTGFRFRPFHPFGRDRPGTLAGRRVARWLIVGLVWCGPLILALASPVVPAADVLPNHVAPAEHLRVFGSIASLATYPSPIYGPSRLFLGYSSLMAILATLTGLPAGLTAAAFTSPLLALSAVGIRRLTSAAFGHQAGWWALVAFGLSFTFVRLPDVRDSVVALPLATLALALMTRPEQERFERTGAAQSASQPPTQTALRPDWLLAVALTATTLVHPLVGALTVGTIAVGTLADPQRHVARAVPALVATAIAVLPQLAVMIGLEPAPWWGIVAVGGAALAALLVAWLLGRVGPLRIPAGRATVGLTVVGASCIVVAVLLDPAAIGSAWQSFNPAFPILFGAALLATAGLAPTRRGGRRLLLAALAVGAGALLAVAFVPDTSVVGASLRYEVPKAVGYWLPWACVPAAAGLVAAATRWRGPWPIRASVLGAFLAVVLIPLGPPQPNSAQASHPAADVLAQDLQTAERGYWQGYPDVRLVVDSSGDAVLDFLRLEVKVGELDSESRVLHVAASYQESASLPIGVFTGLNETMVSADATTNIFTAGGRIYPLASLPAMLRAGFDTVVLEPAGLPLGTRAMIIAAGYQSTFVNSTAEVFTASR